MSGISSISGDGASYSFRGPQNTRVTVHLDPDTGQAKKPGAVPGQELSKEEEAQVAELRKIDAKVRAHEMAHLAASGGHATSGAKFEYKVGPDGKSYAVAGEVGIDTSPVRDDPQATMAKARTIRGAALAPADPSGADRAVAAAAAQMEAEAAQQLARQQQAERNGEGESSANETRGQRQPPLFGITEPERPGRALDITA